MTIGDATFAGRWTRAVHAVGNRPFLVFEDATGSTRTWTYAEFDRVVADVAGELSARGLRQGDSLHLCLANSPAFVALWLAAARLGACMVPSDPRSASREIAAHLDRSKAVLGVCSLRGEEVYREGVASSGLPCDVVAVDESDSDVSPLRGSRPAVTTAAGVSGSTRAAVMFTSGTTSEPKGVVVTQANYAFAGEVMAAASALDADDRQLVVLPLFHANAQYYSFASAIAVGASVALMSGFSASGFLEQATRHRATHASLFAAPMRMILAREPSPVPGIRLRHLWYAQNITRDQYEALSGLLGCRPRQLYGMTETIPAVLTNPALEPVHDALGDVTLGCHVGLVGVDGTSAVTPGEVGEIVVGGARGSRLFESYLDDPVTTEASFRDDWFLTGDLAWRDPDGRFRFAGRRSDVLKVAGENVSTVEIEAVLAEHPSVLEAAVVGEPDPIRDEVPVAFVVAAPGTSIDKAVLEQWCAAGLAPAKRPRRITVVDELPRTSVGKIRKFVLRESDAPPR